MNNMLYVDKSTKGFPKTLLIHNHEGGMVWQVYHVENEHDLEMLCETAENNRFDYRLVTDLNKELEETWPDWRETKYW